MRLSDAQCFRHPSVMITASPKGSSAALDLEKLTYPLQAGYYCPELAAGAALKLLALLDADPHLNQQLPSGLKEDISDHLLTEEDEDITHVLRKLERMLRPTPKAMRRATVDARVLDGVASCEHWSSHVHVSGDLQSVWAEFHF